MSELGAQSVRVLIVEDNQDDQELLTRQLRKINAADHVKFIPDGARALDFLSSANLGGSSPELVAIFLDLKLPSMSGLEVLRWVKTHEHLQDIPVIIMTSSIDPKDMEECHQLKVTYFIPKPITLETFTQAVANIFHLPANQAAP